MKVELNKEFRFEAAHQLPATAPTHKCHTLHGHSYRVELTLAGEVDPDTGWLIDFGRIDELVAPLLRRLDHRTLNDVPGLTNPTSENLAVWIWQELRTQLPALTAVTVWETVDARCTYRGE
jgi:6-pyruvoyltetrahydropterin/6-carboxytetrahydropterin synthase